MTVKKEEIVAISADERVQKIGLHRYHVIYPFIAENFSEVPKSVALKEMSDKVYQDPISGEDRKYSPKTIDRWINYYYNNGKTIEALYPRVRSDKGVSRVLSATLVETVRDIKTELPDISGAAIHRRLVKDGVSVSLSTINKLLISMNLNSKKKDTTAKRAFEKRYANDLFQGDTNYGPYIVYDGKPRRTYLITLLDDASRRIVAARYFWADTSINVQKVIKEAIMNAGIPKKFMFDNGSSFRNANIKYVVANIGSSVHYNPPYTPYKKGKQEVFFRVLDQLWLNEKPRGYFETIEQLNRELDEFIYYYNRKFHSSINMSPMERWQLDEERFRYLNSESIDSYFLNKIERKVKNDGTISINKIIYEVPYKLVGKKIDVVFTPEDNDEDSVYMVYDGEKYVVLSKLDKVANDQRRYPDIEDNTTPADVPKLPPLPYPAGVEQYADEQQDKLNYPGKANG